MNKVNIYTKNTRTYMIAQLPINCHKHSKYEIRHNRQ